MKYYVSKTDNKGGVCQYCFATKNDALEFVEREKKIAETLSKEHSLPLKNTCAVVGNTIHYANGYMVHYSVFEELAYDFC